MIMTNRHQTFPTSGTVTRLLGGLLLASALLIQAPAWAGAFIFASETRQDLILHPKGYNGSGGVVNLGVCILPTSQNASLLEIPVQNNIIVWNELQPLAQNLQTGVISGLDAESVLLHEFGHVAACRSTGGEADEILMWPLGGLAFTRPVNDFKAQFFSHNRHRIKVDLLIDICHDAAFHQLFDDINWRDAHEGRKFAHG